MEILFVTHDIDVGGAARSLSVLVPRLRAFGHNIRIVSLAAPAAGRTPCRLYASLGIPVFVLPFPWIPVGYAGVPAPANVFPPHVRKQHAATIQAMGEFAADVACFNGYPSMSLAPFVNVKRKVLLAREVVDVNSPRYHLVVKGLQRNLDHAVAIGPVEAAQLASWNIPHDVVFNTAFTMPEFRPAPPMPPMDFGCFGHICESKGQGVLVVAAAAVGRELREAGARIRVFGTGSKDYHGMLAQFVEERGIGDIVRLEGWVNDVEQTMREIHCVVRPDLSGSPWGRDIVEAMSLGRPVLATGTQDVFVKPGKTGWLVPPDQPEALARMLRTLCEDPELLRQAGSEAFDFAVRHFDPETNARRIEAVLAAT